MMMRVTVNSIYPLCFNSIHSLVLLVKLVVNITILFYIMKLDVIDKDTSTFLQRSQTSRWIGDGQVQAPWCSVWL